MKSSRSQLAFAALLLAQCVAFGQKSKPATSNSADDVISACVSRLFGTVRIVTSARQCLPEETFVQWNQTGPTGPIGATGLRVPLDHLAPWDYPAQQDLPGNRA